MLRTTARKQALVASIAALCLIVPGVQITAGHVAARPVAQGDQFLDPSKIVLKSVISIDLTKNLARLPLHRGNFHGKTVWYIITDASDYGIANDLNVLYAPKLANVPIGCSECVQHVSLSVPANNKFDEAVVNFQGIPDFSPTRVLVPSPTGFPPLKAQPGAVGDAHYSPFIQFPGSSVVYNAPIVAVGDGPFDVIHHTNTADRVIAINTKSTAQAPATVDLLAIHGSDSGQPILYLNFEGSDPVASSYERVTYVPLLNKVPFLGGDDFIASARERIFVFGNGQTGLHNPQAQGENNVGLNGGSLDANVATLGRITDPFNVQGDFPTLASPRHANAYSPIWDVQLGFWTPRALGDHLDARQTDENQILNLAVKGLITGPGGAPYGSAGIVVNCPPIAYLDKAPTADLAQNPLNR
jgi:hypothetical protein